MTINYFANKPMPTLPNPFVEQEQTAPKKQQGIGGDMLDSATAGLFDSVGGVLDLVGAKGFAKDFYGWADENRQEMSDEGKAAIGKSIIEKDEAGEWSFGEGASDLDTWLLGFANMAGQFATSVVPGAGAGALAAKAGLAAKGVNAARIAGYAAGGGSAATGQAMEEGRQEVMAMPDDVLMKSDRFADAVRQTYKPDMSDDEAFDTAKAFLADQVAQDIRTDPKVLLANYGASAIGDPIIGRALAGARIAKGALRSAGKGFVTEGATEAVQAGTTQYGVNEALQPIDGRDAWDGVDVAAANEGVMGGVFGAAAGGFGGVLNRQPEPVKDPDADAIRESNPVLAIGFDGIAQDKAKRDADLASVIGGMNAENQPALEGELLGPEPAPSELMMITDKNTSFAGDGRPQQAAQEFTDNLQREANQAASVPRLPQQDIIFAGDESGVRVKGNGEVYKSPREAMTSKQARAMKRSGTPVEAVQFGDGWGWRVKESQPDQQVEQAQPEVQPAQEVQPQPVQMKKSGDPFKSEKEMKISASYKAAAATGTELETVPVDGGFGFRVKASSISDVAPSVSEPAVKEQPVIQNAEPIPQGAEIPAAIASQSPDLPPRTDIEAGPAELSVSQNGGDSADTLAEPAPAVQEVSDTPQMDSTGFAVESDANSVKVYGDPASIRQTLRSRGINFDGAEIDGGLSFGKKLESRIRPVFENAEIPVDAVQTENSNVSLVAPTSNAATELPAILQTTKKKYIAQQVKQQKLKESSPGYTQAVARLEEQYESGIDRAQAGLTFEQFNALNTDSPEPVNRQAYKALREEFGFPESGAEKLNVNEQLGQSIDADLAVEVPRRNQPVQFSSTKVGPSEEGDLDAGEISADLSKVVGRQAGRIIMKNGDGEYGRVHITNRHNNEITSLGYTVDSFVSEVGKNYNALYKAKSGHLLLAKENGKDYIMFVRLEPSADGDFYNVRTAFASQKRKIKNGLDRGDLELLWKKTADSSVAASSELDFAADAGDETGQQSPNVSRENNSNQSIAENSTTEQPQQLDSKNPDIQFTQQNTIKAKPAKGVNSKLAKQFVAGIMQRLNGAAGIKVVVLETQAEAEALWQMSLSGDLVRGAYNRATNTAYVIAENIKSMDELREVVAHEVIGHGGLQNVISKADYKTFIERLKQTRNNRAFAEQWAQIDNDYDGFSENDKAEELFAYFVQNKPVTGPVKFWWNALKRWLHKALVSVGLAKAGDPDVEAMQDMLESIRVGFAVGRSALTPKARSSTLFLSESLLKDIRNKYEGTGLEQWWEDEFGTGFDKLTESEGRYILDAEDADTVRNSVAAPRQEASPPKGQIDTGSDANPENLAFSKSRTAEAFAGTVTDFVGRKRLDPNDPYAVENRRLKEQDRTLWDKAKQVFMRHFAPGGLLPRSIFDAKITRDGELESGEMTIKHLIFALERAVQKDTGKNVDNQSDEFINMMADALAGKVDDKLGNETKAALVAMRQYIDALSGDYLSVIQAKIDELTERIKQDDKYTDKVQALNEIELYEKIKGNMGVYVNRSYRAFDDPKWFQKVPVDVINRAREYLRKQYKSQGDDQAEANRKAEVTLNKILKTDTAYDSMASFIAESKLGAKDLSTLIARKDISPEIRELLGEYKDPRMNFAKTATKMARLVWNSRFLDKVKADGVGVFFFDEDSRPAEATVQIAGDNSKAYEPLNGYWTFPEVAEALQDSLGAEKMEAWYEAAVKLTSMVKYGKTVLSPTTAMRNWQSAMFFAVANGHFDFKHMKKSLAAFREQVSQSATGDDLAYLKKLKKLGVVYDAPYAGEMMQLLSDSKIDEWLEGRKGKVFGTARQINNLAQGFYSFGDDFWKIIGYENEKANFISAGLSETEAEKMAAERIRNTYPTYSMVGRAIKKLARFPLMGTFVSFPAEIIRTTANMLRYAAQDMKSDNPKIRAMARKRLTGMALVSGMFYALSAMTAAMLGVDDEEEEAIRDVGPSWQKNSTFLFYGRDDKGKLQYFDISFLDPYGYFKRPITALLRDQPWEDAAASGAADMLSPFFGADITAGTFFQVFANKKQSGGQVYNEYADTTDQLADISGHILKGLSPGFINNGLGIFNAAMGNRREGSGKEYDLGDEMMALMGWRASSLDAPTALYYRSFDFADQLQAANSTLNKVLRSDNSVDDDDIADAKEEAQRQYDDAFKQMQRIVQSGRNAGMAKEQVYRTLKLSGVSSRNISGLVNGNIPPMQAATLQTQVKAVAKAREIRGDEQASEVLRRFQIARQLQ